MSDLQGAGTEAQDVHTDEGLALGAAHALDIVQDEQQEQGQEEPHRSEDEGDLAHPGAADPHGVLAADPADISAVQLLAGGVLDVHHIDTQQQEQEQHYHQMVDTSAVTAVDARGVADQHEQHYDSVVHDASHDAALHAVDVGMHGADAHDTTAHTVHEPVAHVSSAADEAAHAAAAHAVLEAALGGGSPPVDHNAHHHAQHHEAHLGQHHLHHEQQQLLQQQHVAAATSLEHRQHLGLPEVEAAHQQHHEQQQAHHLEQQHQHQQQQMPVRDSAAEVQHQHQLQQMDVTPVELQHHHQQQHDAAAAAAAAEQQQHAVAVTGVPSVQQVHVQHPQMPQSQAHHDPHAAVHLAASQAMGVHGHVHGMQQTADGTVATGQPHVHAEGAAAAAAAVQAHAAYQAAYHHQQQQALVAAQQQAVYGRQDHHLGALAGLAPSTAQAGGQDMTAGLVLHTTGQAVLHQSGRTNVSGAHTPKSSGRDAPRLSRTLLKEELLVTQVLDIYKAQDKPLPDTLRCAKELMARSGTFPADAVIPPPGVTPLTQGDSLDDGSGDKDGTGISGIKADLPNGLGELFGVRPTRKSHYRGVEWDRSVGKWRARITHQGKKLSLGSFVNEEDAARTYNEMARRLKGHAAQLNDVPDTPSQPPDAVQQQPQPAPVPEVPAATLGMDEAGEHPSSKSGYRGVTWDRRENRWRARITYQGKHKAIGRYCTEFGAALAYDKMAIVLLGDRARTNFDKKMVMQMLSEEQAAEAEGGIGAVAAGAQGTDVGSAVVGVDPSAQAGGMLGEMAGLMAAAAVGSTSAVPTSAAVSHGLVSEADDWQHRDKRARVGYEGVVGYAAQDQAAMMQAALSQHTHANTAALLLAQQQQQAVAQQHAAAQQAAAAAAHAQQQQQQHVDAAAMAMSAQMQGVKPEQQAPGAGVGQQDSLQGLLQGLPAHQAAGPNPQVLDLLRKQQHAVAAASAAQQQPHAVHAAHVAAAAAAQQHAQAQAHAQAVAMHNAHHAAAHQAAVAAAAQVAASQAIQGAVASSLPMQQQEQANAAAAAAAAAVQPGWPSAQYATAQQPASGGWPG